jgi:hypothetical protein
MPDSEIAALIDRIVLGARIPNRGAREDLRRELEAHFEDAADAAGGGAVQRFGREEMLVESFRRVYRRDYALLYSAKIAASMAASLVAAVALEALVYVRVDAPVGSWRLASGFTHGAGVSIALVIGLIAARELLRRPFGVTRLLVAAAGYALACLAVQVLTSDGRALISPTLLVAVACLATRVEARSLRVVAVFSAFTATLYGTHLLMSVAFGAGRAMLSSAGLVLVWSSTAAILARFEHAFEARVAGT